jgi:hypothetical protein
MKIALVTANIGGMDCEKIHPEQTIEVDRYYYTDKNTPYTFQDVNQRLAGKYFKMCTHKLLPEYDVFIWMDANIQIKSSQFIEFLINALGENDIAISKHPVRGSVKEECDFICTEIDKGNRYLSTRYNKEAMRKELEFIGEVENLYWCGLFIRRNTPELNEIFETWFEGNILYQAFDQNLFSKYAPMMKLKTFDMGSFYDNQYYSIVKHSKLK